MEEDNPFVCWNSDANPRVSKNEGPLLGAPVTRIALHWCLHGGSLFADLLSSIFFRPSAFRVASVPAAAAVAYVTMSRAVECLRGLWLRMTQAFEGRSNVMARYTFKLPQPKP